MASQELRRIRFSQGNNNLLNNNEGLTNGFLKVQFGVCYKKFDEMRRNEQLCDIKIIAKNGEEMWAHKVVLAANSEYFNIMFNSEFKESKDLEIKIQELDPHVLSSLIDFIYSSELVVNEQNVQDILNGICLLQLGETILNECVDYIKSRIDSSNCLGFAELADCLGLRDFYTFCLNYTLVYFCQVHRDDEFLLIPLERILEIIKSEDLCGNEKNVYKSVMKWIKYDEKNRYKHLPDLMQYVRLPIVSKKFFQSTVDTEPLLKLNKNCRTYLNEAYAVHAVIGTELKASNTIRTQYRQRYSEYVLIMNKSGKLHVPLLFNIIRNKWKTIRTTVPLRIGGITHLLNDGSLIDLGGLSAYEAEQLDPVGFNDYNYSNYNLQLQFDSTSGFIFNSHTGNWRPIQKMHMMHLIEQKLNIVQIGSCVYVINSNISEVYNIERDEWFEMNSFNIKRTDCTVIALNGFIYAVGGEVDNRQVKFVEKFDPNTNIWKSVAPMLHGRCAPTLCILDGCMYAIGGKQYPDHYLTLVEKYDPSTDSWEEVAKLNRSRFNAGAVAVNGFILVFGGNPSTFTIEMYCPYTKKWSVQFTEIPYEFDLYHACSAFNVQRDLQSTILNLTM